MTLDHQDITAIWITFKLALISTFFLFIIGTPIAWWLSQTKSKFKVLVESLIGIPLVLPPTVLGFYLLIAFGNQSFPARFIEDLTGKSFAFTFEGLVIGSVIYSIPFVVQPLKNSFSSIGKRPLEIAATLGASPLDRFISIVLPMSKSGFITAGVLGFAHTLGEFGVVLMIGGNIPGETKVLSIAIYEHVESLQYGQAHILSAGLLIFSFILLFIIFTINRHQSLDVKS